MAHPTISEIIERRLISGDPEIVPTADEPVRAVDVLGPFAAVYRFSVGRNRSWFEDCSIALRTGRGSWRETTSGSARGEGRDVPWRPSSRIFDGRSVCVFGSAGIDLPDEEERMVARAWDLRVLRANGASFARKRVGVKGSSISLLRSVPLWSSSRGKAL